MIKALFLEIVLFLRSQKDPSSDGLVFSFCPTQIWYKLLILMNDKDKIKQKEKKCKVLLQSKAVRGRFITTSDFLQFPYNCSKAKICVSLLTAALGFWNK